GQSAAGSDAEIHGRRRHGLRHGDAGRTAAVHQDGQLAVALHRLDDCARPRWRDGLEWLPDLLDALLAFPASLQHETVVHQTGELPFLDRDAGNFVLRHSDLYLRRHGSLDVETVQQGWLSAISELPGNHFAGGADVQTSRDWRHALSGRRV